MRKAIKLVIHMLAGGGALLVFAQAFSSTSELIA